MKRNKLLKFVVLSLLPISVTSCSPTSIQDKVCTLNFYDGDNLIKTISGKYGTKIDDDILSEIKVKENTTFKGWYLDKEHSTKKEDVLYFPFQSEVNYYGFFANHITITLLKNDENATYPTTYTSGDKTLDYSYTYKGVEGDIIENLNLPTPSKEFYTFSGWYNLKDDTLFSSRTYPSEDISLYAKFEEYPTISFVTNNSKTIDPIKVAPNTNLLEAISSLNITEDTLYLDDNHKFYNWYYDENFENIVNLTTEVMPNSSITLYAKYVSKVTIKFDVSSISDAITFDDITCFPGENINPPSLSSIDLLDTEETYFDSWYEKNEDGTFKDEPFFKDNKVMPDVEQDIIVYPKMLDKVLVTIFDGDDNLIASKYVKDSITCNIESLTLKGDASTSIRDYISNKESTQDKKFIGFYYLDKKAEKVFIQNSVNYIPSEDISLYLEFEDLTTQTYTFEDPYGKSYTDLSCSIKSYDVVNDPSEALNKYLDSTITFTGVDYKISKILDESNKVVSFPINATNSTYKVIVSKKVKVTYKLYTVDNSNKATLANTSSITCYQEQPFVDSNGNEVSPITNNGTHFYIYGEEIVQIDASKYILNKVYIDNSENTEISLYTLGPSESVTINIYFTLIN